MQNPCGDNYSVSEIEISFSLVSGQSDSATTPPPLQFDSSQCITQTDDICISDASGVAGFASMPSPISVCSLTIDASMYNGSPPMLGVAYTVNVTLTLTRPAGQVYGPQSYTVTEEVGNFVPNAANPRTTPGYFQPAVYTATAVKTANPMRGWYGVPAGAKPTTGSQPQSFVILQPPSFSGSGSYSTADLSQYVTSSSIPTDVVHNTVFLESPVVENISGLQSDVLVVNDEAAQLFDDDEAMPVMTATPCRVTNNPVVCDCGTVVTGGETSLDVQMTTAAAQGGHTVAFHSGYFTAQYAPYSEAMQESQLLLSVFWAILYGNVKPWTLSYSYGYPLGCPDSVEADAAMIEFIEPYFASLGLIGTSVFVASGDQGAHWSCGPPASTINPNVSLNYDPMGGCFAPSGEVTYTSSYPAVSQYVTAVGGSSLQPVGVGAPTLPGAGANTACPGGGQLWPGGDANEGVCVSGAVHLDCNKWWHHFGWRVQCHWWGRMDDFAPTFLATKCHRRLHYGASGHVLQHHWHRASHKQLNAWTWIPRYGCFCRQHQHGDGWCGRLQRRYIGGVSFYGCTYITAQLGSTGSWFPTSGVSKPAAIRRSRKRDRWRVQRRRYWQQRMPRTSTPRVRDLLPYRICGSHWMGPHVGVGFPQLPKPVGFCQVVQRGFW